jgi:hypothetical protein
MQKLTTTEEAIMHDFWMRNQKPFGNFSDPEIVELAAIHRQYLAADQDPEVWSNDDFQEFERDRAAFERYHKQP